MLRFFQTGLTHDFRQKLQFPLCLFLHKMNFEIVVDDHPVSKKSTPKLQQYGIYRVTKLYFSKGFNP